MRAGRKPSARIKLPKGWWPRLLVDAKAKWHHQNQGEHPTHFSIYRFVTMSRRSLSDARATDDMTEEMIATLASDLGYDRYEDLLYVLKATDADVRRRTPGSKPVAISGPHFRLVDNRENPQWADYREVKLPKAGLQRAQCRISTKAPYFRFGFKLLRPTGPVFGDTKVESSDPELLIHVGRNTDSRPLAPAHSVFITCYENGQRVERDQELFRPRKQVNALLDLRRDGEFVHLFVNETCYLSRRIRSDISRRLLLIAWGDGNEVVIDVEDCRIE